MELPVIKFPSPSGDYLIQRFCSSFINFTFNSSQFPSPSGDYLIQQLCGFYWERVL